MIGSWEELGKVLDDIDCRLYVLEQSQMLSNYSLYHPNERSDDVKPEPLPDAPQWTRGQWDKVNQLSGMVRHLNNKITELRAKEQEEYY